MRLRVALVLLVVAALAAPAFPALAQDDDPVDRQAEIADQLDELHHQSDEADAQEAELVAAYERSQQRARAFEARIAELDAQLTATQAELVAARARLHEVLDRKQRVARRARVVQERRDEARDVLEQQAVAAYMGTADETRLSALLLRAEDARQVLLTSGYAQIVAQRQRDLIDELDDLVAELSRLERRIATAERKATTMRDGIKRRVDALARDRQAQASARAGAAAEAEAQAGLIAKVRSRKAEVEQRIAELERESDAISALLRARQAGQGIVPSGHGVLSVPIPGAPITSGFGPRVHPILHTTRVHTGVDFGAASGTPIRAAAAGEVVWAAWRGGYGLATVIDHGNSLATLYGHQSAIAVREGDRVVRGQVIGYVGSTGFSTGPHLHFEVRVNGNPVDPMNYL